MTAAGELKYMRAIKKLLAEQMENPSDEFVRFCASKVFEGPVTPARREYFHDLTKRAFAQLFTERINERLKTALTGDMINIDEEAAGEDLIETTAEELEGFYLIKSLLRDVVDPARIGHRDTQSYMGILLDDNNRKPIARLHFNRARKVLGVFDENRKEERVPIESLNDIFKHADNIRRVFAFYEKEKAELKKGEVPISSPDQSADVSAEGGGNSG